MAKEINKEKERTEAVVDAVSKTDLFFSENKKTIIAVVCVLIVVCAGIFLYHKYGYLPARQEAMEQMFPAEENFRNGEYELALNGDGNVLGFAQVIDLYGGKAGSAAYLYAGICELNLGNWNEALAGSHRLSFRLQGKGQDPEGKGILLHRRRLHGTQQL